MFEEHQQHLLRLRDEVLSALEEADRELSEVRMRAERLESDVRIGRPEPGEYSRLKGRLLPQAEERVVKLYRELTKIEDKINATRAGKATE
ncbi:MAG TPA: hypothetical protein VFU47_14520 [Armatimonadota bacterium]|nr:hypothetical protein [Armatimonadota bacterium]